MDRETAVRIAVDCGAHLYADTICYRGDIDDFAISFAAAVEANCVPPGWKVVPIMPTEAMQEAFYAQMEKGEWAMATWEAMLSAAPAQKEES